MLVGLPNLSLIDLQGAASVGRLPSLFNAEMHSPNAGAVLPRTGITILVYLVDALCGASSTFLVTVNRIITSTLVAAGK